MTQRTCPICEKAPPGEGYTPFCSRRCADVDLQRWFSGRYAIPVVEDPDKPSPSGEFEAD
ncbi:MAG: DNA gyrase inhibitor YacG [Caulobacteraceae bacterium]|nr:DNA gyrase inhibitor YacG [Caulobacteraceae bacterium]